MYWRQGKSKCSCSSLKSNLNSWALLAPHWLLHTSLQLSADRLYHYTVQIPVDLQISEQKPILITNIIAYDYFQIILCIQTISFHAEIKHFFQRILIIYVFTFMLVFWKHGFLLLSFDLQSGIQRSHFIPLTISYLGI